MEFLLLTQFLGGSGGESAPLSGGQSTNGLTSPLQGLDLGFITGELNEILSNGFMLSCFNSTFTPTRAAVQFETILTPWLIESIQTLDNAQGVNEVQSALNEVIRRGYLLGSIYIHVLQNNDWRNCSKKALEEVYIPSGRKLQLMVDEVIKTLEQRYTLTKTGSTQINALLEIPEHGIKEWGDNDTITIPVYKVSSQNILTNISDTITGSNRKLFGLNPLFALVIISGLFYSLFGNKNNNKKQTFKFLKRKQWYQK